MSKTLKCGIIYIDDKGKMKKGDVNMGDWIAFCLDCTILSVGVYKAQVMRNLNITNSNKITKGIYVCQNYYLGVASHGEIVYGAVWIVNLKEKENFIEKFSLELYEDLIEKKNLFKKEQLSKIK
ncbi:MAG: hypothetical protein ACOCQR_03115 [bacterium]